jgi:hypothetical protein
MQKSISIITALLLLASFQTPTCAAKVVKSATPVKDRLVLMPLRVPDEDSSLLGSMETALVQGMQMQYEVFSGEQVAQKAKAIFLKESRNTAKKECDETRCMQDIAIAFQAELIATANVTKRDGGYFLALSIQNIFDNKVVYSNSVACKGCDSFQVIDKLKGLSNPSTSAPPQPNIVETAPVANTSSVENELWSSVSKGNSVEEYTFYLKKYPNGQFKDLAEIRLNKLKTASDAEAEQTEQHEQRMWDVALRFPTASNFQSYLNRYPKGKYAQLAQSRLKGIDTEKEYREENELWNKAKNNDEFELKSYIRRFPAGRHLTEAQDKLTAMDKQKQSPEYTDPKTGLIWRRCVEGIEYTPGVCIGTGLKMTYEEALQHAAALVKKTGVAWRVPQKDELFSIVDNNFSPRINPVFFPYTPAKEFWTATPIEKSTPSSKCTAWSVIFFNGRLSEDLCSYRYYVRLVRSAK